MIRPKRLLRGVVKTAIKASPIPIPDFVQEQLGLQNDEMKSLLRKIDRLEKNKQSKVKKSHIIFMTKVLT